MLIGYARVSKADGSQGLDPQRDALTGAQARLAQTAMANRDTSVTDSAVELGTKPVTLYRYVGPRVVSRENGQRVLEG